MKLRQLSEVLAHACALPKVSKKLMQGLVGLLVHPFLHRRLAVSVLQDTFLWIEKLGDKEPQKMPLAVREELFTSTPFVPFKHPFKGITQSWS